MINVYKISITVTGHDRRSINVNSFYFLFLLSLFLNQITTTQVHKTCLINENTQAGTHMLGRIRIIFY